MNVRCVFVAISNLLKITRLIDVVLDWLSVLVDSFKHFMFNRNLCEQFVAEHCIKFPSQTANEFALSCQLKAQIDLVIQFGWQSMTRNRRFGRC
jgi:hypothetical protein